MDYGGMIHRLARACFCFKSKAAVAQDPNIDAI